MLSTTNKKNKKLNNRAEICHIHKNNIPNETKKQNTRFIRDISVQYSCYLTEKHYTELHEKIDQCTSLNFPTMSFDF